MKIGLSKTLIALGMCAGLLLFSGTVKADEAQQVTQELISGLDIPADVAEYIVNGQGTLGERIQAGVDNGSINQRQYNSIVNRFSALPDEKRWAIKDSWDNVGSEKIAPILGDLLHPDGRPLRDHVKDLRAEGLDRNQIAQRLRNEGVSADHLKALGVIPGVPSRPGHYKDTRDAGAQGRVDAAHQRYQNIQGQTSDATAEVGSIRGGHIKDNRDAGNQPQTDKAHEKYQGRKAEPSRPAHLKDKPQRSKDARDFRKDNRQPNRNFRPRAHRGAQGRR